MDSSPHLPAGDAATALAGASSFSLHLERLVRAVQDLSSVRTIEGIRDIVRHAARELTGADGATFVLRDGECCHYVDEDAIAPLWKGQRFPMSACVSGWVMKNRTPAVVPDIYDDPRVPVDAYRRTFVKSLVMVPIRSADPVGAIGAYWSFSRRVTALELRVLQALADTTAVAMENVRVYHELETRVMERTRLLEHANEELESFVGSVSHDLRAPLAVIAGYADLLRMTGGDALSEKSLHLLRQIPVQVLRMSALIDDLLRLARIRNASLAFAPVDLRALAAELLGEFARRDPARSVECVLGALAPVQGDAPLLRIALENLLSNAWKYTGRTECPRIEFGQTELPDGEVAYYVADNGAGFDPEAAGRLFTPFQRLHSDSEYAGTGVGLTIVARIIEKHGGRIWAEGTPGQGARFWFTLGATRSA